MQLCEYGCGEEAKHQFKNGKWCCSKSYNQCENVKRNKIYWNKDKTKVYSKETLLLMSEAAKKRIGIKSSRFGKKHTVKTKLKISEKTKGYKHTVEDKIKIGLASQGRKHSEKTKNKIKEKLKGKIPWNKNKKNVYSKKSLKKFSKAAKGRKHSIKTKRLLSKMKKGKYILSIKQLKEKYPTFVKVEEMRYEPGKEKEKLIQVHCKNHKCKNSKEQGGWFTPKRNQFYERIWAIERSNGYGENNYYCSEECKRECPLFNLRKDPFQIKKDYLYTYKEYQTWRITVLERENYLCEYCDEPATDVHHSRPQKLEPGFVLDPDFGVTCCEKHHYKYGHKDECSTGNLANIVCKEGI